MEASSNSPWAPVAPVGVERTGGPKGRWFSKEPKSEAGPKLRGCLGAKEGPGADAPKSVGREREGFCVGVSTEAEGVGFSVSGGRGREMDGVRG